MMSSSAYCESSDNVLANAAVKLLQLTFSLSKFSEKLSKNEQKGTTFGISNKA